MPPGRVNFPGATVRRISGRSVAANTLASGASDRGCESLRPDHFIAVSSNSRTADFESENGGATPPAAATFRGSSHSRRAAGSYPAHREAATASVPTIFHGSMAQQSAQLPHKEKVAGANPARAPTICRRSVNRDAARWYRADGDASAPDGSTIFCRRSPTGEAQRRER